MSVTTNLLIWRSLRRKNDRVCERNLRCGNHSYLETSAINVSEQDRVHVAIVIN